MSQSGDRGRGGYRGGKGGFSTGEGKGNPWRSGWNRPRARGGWKPGGSEAQLAPVASGGTSESTSNVTWNLDDSNKKEVEEELPFVFEKLDPVVEKICSDQLSAVVWERRRLAKNRLGNVITDCQTMHTITEICQFCGGGRPLRGRIRTKMECIYFD